VSAPVDEGGLGFDYKWNMGWMHDSLEYMKRDPVHRSWHHDELSFSMVYAYSERYVLPLSHDEVVHGKGSLLGKMPGDRWRQLANLRAYLAFMWAHPGKKLLFMGGELGQESEWNHDEEIAWYLLEQDGHAGLQRLVGDLNRLYRDEPALHRRDADPGGFEWLVGGDAANSVFAFLRKGHDGDPPIAFAVNMTPQPQSGYRLPLPRVGRWRELLNTDAQTYGGSGLGNAGGVEASGGGADLLLPPLAALMLRHEG
jgi:1,4-alpha-glucan branching enzyme